eukprot:TRINITY_DN5700_c0_g1_i1.p1 TRINITY_DN5700_c0_g1~~TRINITY_DN5700_c0_g1_i1.p1  ORF type:complete len:732 (+),score=204.70 TRINITY_DN5700_c0_g1_i1:66-2261(+)
MSASSARPAALKRSSSVATSSSSALSEMLQQISHMDEEIERVQRRLDRFVERILLLYSTGSSSGQYFDFEEEGDEELSEMFNSRLGLDGNVVLPFLEKLELKRLDLENQRYSRRKEVLAFQRSIRRSLIDSKIREENQLVQNHLIQQITSNPLVGSQSNGTNGTSNISEDFNSSTRPPRTSFFLGEQRVTSEIKQNLGVSSMSVSTNNGHTLGGMGSVTVSASDSAVWDINPKDIEIREDKLLGTGNFGSVYRGRLLGKEVAIKKLNVQQWDEESLAEFVQEVQIMSSLRHPHIILFLGSVTKPPNLCIVTEIMAKGSVFDLLHPKKGECELNFKRRFMMAKDAAQGMNWLHKMQPAFLHLDLKTMNLLVDENFVVKVSDFGLAQMKNKKYKGHRGSPLYMSPEMLLDQEYGSKADVYSFGIVLWELLTLKLPYDNRFQTFEEMFDAVAVCGDRPILPKDTIKRLSDLITSCWDVNPSNRPSFDDMLRSDVFDHIVLEGTISSQHEVGLRFWKDNFFGEWSVPWKNFSVPFTKLLGIEGSTSPSDQGKLLLVKSVLLGGNPDKEESVLLENYSRFLDWFGPLQRGNSILDKVYSVLCKPYFHGFVGTQQAEKSLISKKKVGTYLLRFSTSEPGAFSVSAITLENPFTVTHYRITYQIGRGYLLGGNAFNNLDELLCATKLHKTMKPPMVLKNPLTPSPYNTILLSINSKTNQNIVADGVYAPTNEILAFKR